MNPSDVTIRLELEGACYPGETLAGDYSFPVEGEEVEAVEVSVVWYTEGKGDEDLGVHHFERLEFRAERESAGPPVPRFATRLPPSPLSYEGLIVNVRWCVRVRVFLADGRELYGEAPFQLGDLPPAEEARP